MSEQLHWRPTRIIENQVGDNLLKAIMTKRHKLPYQLDMHDIEYLKGVRDSGVNGAEELINAIGMHSQIELFLEG